MPRLSEAQVRALRELSERAPQWQGLLVSSADDLTSLLRRGFATSRKACETVTEWTITTAGRAALQTHEEAGDSV